MNNLTNEHFEAIETFLDGICKEEVLFTEKPNLNPFQDNRITRIEFDSKLIHDTICVLLADASMRESAETKNKRLMESNAKFQERLKDLSSELDRIKKVATRIDNLKSYKEEKLK